MKYLHRYFIACSILFKVPIDNVQSQVLEKREIDVKRDSLLKLAGNKKDTAAVWHYLHIAELYKNDRAEIAIQYLRKAESISKSLNYFSGKRKSLGSLAISFYHQGSYDSMLFYYKKELELLKAEGDSVDIAVTLIDIGKAYQSLEEYDLALRYALEAAKILESSDNKEVLVHLNDVLQVIYFSIPNYDIAISYGEKALQQARELKDDFLIMRALVNLSLSFSSKNQLVKAKSLLLEALKIALKIDNAATQCAIMIDIIEIYRKEREYDKVNEYAIKALELSKRAGLKHNECIALRCLSIYYLHQKKYQLAKEYIDKSYALADSNDYKYEKASCLKVLSNISFATQDLIQGENYFDMGIEVFEGIFNERYSEVAAQYEKKFQLEKKENQIKTLDQEKKIQNLSLQQKNILIYIFSGVFLTLLIMGFFVYLNYNSKQTIQQQQINQLQNEKLLLASESILKGQENERSRMAQDLHDGLGGMLSSIKLTLGTMKGNVILTEENARLFSKAFEQLDSSISEMRRVAHNMMPEALVKFGLQKALQDYCEGLNESKQLSVESQFYGLETRIDSSGEIIIYRIIQELTNNSIKHANASNLFVQVIKNENELSITVEDNGIGFNQQQSISKNSAGLSNVRSRVDYLKGQMDIKSAPGNGTSVHIECRI
jgi:two-component system, NarL family, sensor kinase